MCIRDSLYSLPNLFSQTTKKFFYINISTFIYPLTEYITFIFPSQPDNLPITQLIHITLPLTDDSSNIDIDHLNLNPNQQKLLETLKQETLIGAVSSGQSRPAPSHDMLMEECNAEGL